MFSPGSEIAIWDINLCLHGFLFITIANSLDSDQALHFVGPDLDPNCSTLMMFLKDIFEKINFEKNQQMMENHKNYPACIELIGFAQA